MENFYNVLKNKLIGNIEFLKNSERISHKELEALTVIIQRMGNEHIAQIKEKEKGCFNCNKYDNVNSQCYIQSDFNCDGCGYTGNQSIKDVSFYCSEWELLR